jgi:hypothetical protein
VRIRPAHAAERLVDVAEGNPLFLEELTAALLEGADPGDALPTTIRATIAGRVDALPPEHRAALLAASVVGRVFWVGTLRALGQPENIVRGDVEFSFKHMLIRDVCYVTLPRAERRSGSRCPKNRVKN